jgi:PAS domain S-box-containing protein
MKDTEHQFKGYDAGAFDYLMKPIEPTILRSKVRVFCDLYQQRLQIEHHEQQLETIVNERTAELNATLISLRESEKRFRDLLASVTSYMYTVVMEGKRVVATTHGPGCWAVTGFSAEEYAADPDLWHRMIHPEDRRLVLDAAQDILNAKSTHTFEHRIQHKDGSTRWVQNTLVPHCSPMGQLLSYDGVITEITGRKQSEEALQQNEEKYHTLFEECFDCLFVTSPAGRILDMNKKGIVMFGYDTKEEVLCLDLERDVYLHSQDRERILSIVNERGSTEYELSVKKKSGEQMLTHCTLTAVRDETGEVTSYRGIMRDLTERERAEGEIRKLNEELENKVRERTRDLERRNHELEEMNKVFVGRELRMVELKERIRELEGIKPT